MIPSFDLLDYAVDQDVLKGDFVGHPFRGNQWGNASGASTGGVSQPSNASRTNIDFVISKRFLWETEENRSDHEHCDLSTSACASQSGRDSSSHAYMGALTRGAEIKSGIKISDATLEEVNSFINETKHQIDMSSRPHLEGPDVAFARKHNLAMRTQLARLETVKTRMEDAEILSVTDEVEKGDFVGHPFRGNQWTDSSGAGSGSAAGGASYVHAQNEDEASDLVVQITAGNKPSTKAQSNAIQYYGEQGFQMINNFLRYGQDLEFESDAEQDKILNSIEELNTVLNQQTLGVNVVLQRFVDGDIFGELEVGDEYQDEAFQSTSLRGNREITDLFGAKLLIRAPANTRGRYIEADKSRNHSEFEVLLAAGAKYKVVSVVDNGNWKEVVVDLIGQGGDLEPIKN